MDWKPTKIPDGFKLVVDTREREPLFGEPLSGLIVVHKKLDTGDYAIDGYEDAACIERKMLSDFDTFIGRERSIHTIPKLKRMREMCFAALIVEESEASLFGKRKYGRMTPEHARGFLKLCRVGYGVHVYWNKHREDLERYVLDHLCFAYTILKGTK